MEEGSRVPWFLVLLCAVALLFAMCHDARAQPAGAQPADDPPMNCLEGQGVSDSHNWLFDPHQGTEVGDTLRGFAPSGACIGVAVVTDDTSSTSVVLKGQTELSDRNIEVGQAPLFRLFRSNPSGSDSVARVEPTRFEDTALGPSPDTYQMNAITQVSEYELEWIQQGPDTVRVLLDLPADVIVLAEDQDSALVALDYDAPYGDTLRAHQVTYTGGMQVRERSGGYSRTIEVDGEAVHQAVGTEYPGGQVAGEVEDVSPMMWLPAPAVGDTITAQILEAHVVGDSPGQYVVQIPGDGVVRWARTLRGDLNGDGERTLADVRYALDQALSDPTMLRKALTIYRML